MAGNENKLDPVALGPRLDPALDEITAPILEPHDEWLGVRVLGADLSALSANHVDISGCELV